MALLARVLAGPLIVDVRAGAVAGLAELLADRRIATTGRIAVAVGSGVGTEVRSTVEASLSAPIFEIDGGSLASARELSDRLRGQQYEALVGIGGGGSLDVAKWAATAVGLPFVSVATTLTHDGLASPVAALEDNGWKGSYGVQPPIAVVVDLDLARLAPLNHARSGIGEVVSNLSAVADWAMARDVTGEPFDGLAAAMAMAAALSIVHEPRTPPDQVALEALADALIVSGLAMTAAGTSRPCSGACHEISHSIDRLHPGLALHGEQAAVGAMFASYLRQDPRLQDIDECFTRNSVPRLPADIGLDADEFTAVVVAAPATRPGRFTILERLEMDAVETRQRVDDFIETFDR